MSATRRSRSAFKVVNYIAAVVIPVCLSLVLLHILDVINGFTIALAALGIIFGFYLHLESHKQRARLEGIAKSMSTRFVGRFPKHLKDIAELADLAQRDLCILADCVDYGSFSSPHLHDQALDAIVNARGRNVQVQILRSGSPAPISRSSPFFEPSEVTLGSAEFQRCLSAYRARHGPMQLPPTSELTAFKKALNDLLIKGHAEVEKSLRAAGAEIRELAESVEPGLFLWIEDGEEAVFLLDQVAGNMNGLAFRTRDSTLVGILKAAFDAKWNAPIQQPATAMPAAPVVTQLEAPMTEISYRRGNDTPIEQVIELYRATALGERRPLDDPSAMAELMRHANLVVTAWHEDQLVGIARAFTDFRFEAYLSDLAVRHAFQSRGIGIELIRQVRLAIGPESRIVLISAPSAVGYYPDVGFTHFPEAWVLYAHAPLGKKV